MTTTDTLLASQARKAEASASAAQSLKAGDVRSAGDDARFTEELRAASREESRLHEERVRERQADQARAEDARNAKAREDEARTARAREDKARAEDARAEDTRAHDAKADEPADEAATSSTEDATADPSASADADGTADAEAGPVIDTSITEPQIAAAETGSRADTETTVAVKAQTTAVEAAKDQPMTAAGKTGPAAAGSKTADAGTAPGTGTKGNAATGADAAGNQTPGTAGASGEAAGKAAAAQAQAAEAAAAANPADATKTAQAAETTPAAAAAAKTAAAAREAASAPVDAEIVVDAKFASTNGKRGLGHAAADAMSETRGKSKTDAPRDTARADAPAQPADKPAQTTPARSAASEIALQAALKPAPTPADARLSSVDTFANPTPQTADASAPAPSVTIRAIMTATAQPGTPAQPQTPARDIAVNMARNLANGSNTFEIRLDPAELGRVDVRMEVSADGRVQAHLTVDRQETLDMLQRDARALERALSDAGLDMEGGSLGYSLRDQGEGGSGFAMNRGTAEAQNAAPSAEDLSADLAAVQHIYALKAGSGLGVDIRI